MASITTNTRSAPRRKCRASTLQYTIIILTTLLVASLWTIMVQLHKETHRPTMRVFKYKTKPEPRDASTKQHEFALRKHQKDASESTATTNNKKAKATIAYAVSLTSCGHTSTSSSGSGGHSSDPNLYQGAAVLAHSIHLSSIQNPSSNSLYDYKLIVFVHTDARECSAVFASLGYEILVRDTPFQVKDIRGEFLREHIVKSGCCGEKEYLKLYAYTLMDYPIVVHLDLDSLILRPLDDLFDAMLDGNSENGKIPVMFDEDLPDKNPIDAFFTRDYNMVNPGHKHVGVQGGFLVLRPSMEVFHNYVDVVLEGNFKQGNGWGGKGYGGYFGAQQIQGICSYYYDYLHPGTGVELNRCYYNAMTDAPRQEKSGKCRDGREECQDCRDVNVEDVKSVHFTLCSKPWKCPEWAGMDKKGKKICQAFHGEWFRIRQDLEKTRNEQFVNPGGVHRPEIFRGFCNSGHERGYIPILIDNTKR